MMLIDKDSGKYEDHVNYSKHSFTGIKLNSGRYRLNIGTK